VGTVRELCVPVGPFISVGTAFPLSKSKGTEFPCVPAEIKPCLTHETILIPIPIPRLMSLLFINTLLAGTFFVV